MDECTPLDRPKEKIIKTKTSYATTDKRIKDKQKCKTHVVFGSSMLILFLNGDTNHNNNSLILFSFFFHFIRNYFVTIKLFHSDACFSIYTK